MRAFLYLRWRQFANSILSVLRKPAHLIFVLLFAGWLGFNVVILVVSGPKMLASRDFAPMNQLVSSIAPSAPATRRLATGNEVFVRPAIGFTPGWVSTRIWHAPASWRPRPAAL